MAFNFALGVCCVQYAPYQIELHDANFASLQRKIVNKTAMCICRNPPCARHAHMQAPLGKLAAGLPVVAEEYMRPEYTPSALLSLCQHCS
jgi:hypothetical protein